MKAQERLLEDVAGAILDGTPVDWSAIPVRAATTDSALVAQLQTLEALRAVGGRDAKRSVGAFWGHLRVLECIGRGASGEVYRAWDTRLDREVALKLLPSASVGGAARSSIIEEGRLLARVRHANVVTIYGAQRIDDRSGLWMELVKGSTLEELLRRGKVFGITEVIDLGVELCHALSAVHSAGLIHRDVKAQNVMVSDAGRVVLMDFGTGLEKTDGTESVAGTPLYLAPELLSGDIATIQSDIYSLGVLLYRLLTGSYPVDGRDLDQLRRAHLAGARKDLRSIRADAPIRLCRVIERAIDHDPGRRYTSADRLAAGLAGVGTAVLPRRAAAHAIAAMLTVGAVLWGGWELLHLLQRTESPSHPINVAGMLVAAGPPSIAVLPFRSLASDSDGESFVDGLTQEIIRSLATMQGLEVRSSTSSFALKGKRDLREISEKLRVNHLLEASVLRERDRLKIDVQLVRIAGDVPIWSQRFDRPLGDLFAIQDEIYRAVADRMGLAPGRRNRPPQTSVHAYELYLRARALTTRRGRDDAAQAIRLFEQVIASDPSFAAAYAGLADAYGMWSAPYEGLESSTAIARMRAAASRAIELAPQLSEAHAAMGFVNARELDWANAEKAFEKAIALNPNTSHIYESYTLTTVLPLGKSSYAEQLLEAALQADPLSLTVRRQLAFAQFVGGRYDEAIANVERIRAVDPDFPNTDHLLLRTLTFAGRIDEALRLLVPQRGVGFEHWTAAALVRAGRREEVQRMTRDRPQPFQEAVIHAALGDKDRTFEALDRSVSAWSHRVALLLVCPEMALLRGDDRLDGLRRRLKLP